MAELSSEAIAKIESLVLARQGTFSLQDGTQAILVPSGMQVHTTQPIIPELGVIEARSAMYDEDSFIAYVEAFKRDGATRIFATPGSPNRPPYVRAILDYHVGKDPGFCLHTVTFEPRLSDQWKFWTSISNKPLSQVEFAEIIEENRADITQPEAASLLDVVRTFKASKKVEFDSVVYQPNGTVKLAYSEDVQQQGQSGAVPEVMTLGIPVFFRGLVYAVNVFVRFRVSGGKVIFQLKLDRPNVIEDEAFGSVLDKIAKGTKITPYLGASMTI